MTGNDPDQKVADARRRVRESDLPDADKESILEWSKAADDREPDVKGETPALRTNATYTDHLRRIARRRDAPLLEWDTKAVIDTFASMSNDYAPRTLGAYQSAAKAFFQHFSGHGVDVTSIDVDSANDRSMDTTRLLTEEEFFALRDAATNVRDRALVDLLGYTGQRVRAIQTLRVGDVNPHTGPTGRYRLNTDDGGLKGAHKSMQKRPLLGAKRSVIDLLNNHPTGDDDDYLITCLPAARNGTPGEILSQTQIRRILTKLANRTGLDTDDTPVNPHAFRHYAATRMYVDFDLTKDTIKKLLGHDEDSNVFETTYRHLDDEDVAMEAERSFGFETEDSGRSCPPMCPDCHTPLQDGTERCDCGTVVTDAELTEPEPQVLTPDDMADAGEIREMVREVVKEELGLDGLLDGTADSSTSDASDAAQDAAADIIETLQDGN